MSKLYEDALKLSVNENLRNIRTILLWADEATDLESTLGHAKQAFTLLGEVIANLQELEK